MSRRRQREHEEYMDYFRQNVCINLEAKIEDDRFLARVSFTNNGPSSIRDHFHNSYSKPDLLCLRFFDPSKEPVVFRRRFMYTVSPYEQFNREIPLLIPWISRDYEIKGSYENGILTMANVAGSFESLPYVDVIFTYLGVESRPVRISL